MAKKEQPINGSHLLLKSLIQEEVEVIFGYPGGVVIPLYHVMREYPQLKHILTRHEQAAAFAAEGYARASGKAGVCLATSGPGATNLVTGIANAHMDSVPLIAITGQVVSGLIGRDAFQEVDITGITLPITKQNYLVDRAADIPKIVKEAFHIATTGRPGPVHIDIPVDVFREEVKSFIYPTRVNLPGYRPKYVGSLRSIRRAADFINDSNRPLVIAGHGVLISRAWKELIQLLEKCDIPITHTLLGKGVVPEDHPLSLGMIGMHGTARANNAVTRADCIVGIGVRFDDRITGKLDLFGRGAQIIHIDIDPAEIGKNISTHIPVVGDVKNILEQLLLMVNSSDHRRWFKELEEIKPPIPELVHKNELTAPLVISKVAKKVREKFGNNFLVVTDVGQHQMWTAQHMAVDRPNTFLSSGGLGAMGYGLPASIGAKMARPTETVILICGDGGLQMNIQELITLLQEEISIKIFVINNAYLGMVRQWQELFYGKNYASTKLHNPHFVKVAQAYGLEAKAVDKPELLEDAIDSVLDHKGPTLLECKVKSEDNVYPMIKPGAGLKDIIIGRR